MADTFSNKTYQYFDQAALHGVDKAWFESNKNLYLEHVKAPFDYLIDQIYAVLPVIELTHKQKSICRPLRPANKVEHLPVKDFATVDISEKKTSLFEWNPAIYIQVGSQQADNFFGLGLYMVSSRQMKLLRENFYYGFKNIDEILTNPDLVNAWGGLAGEMYKRFPKGYDQEKLAAKYLWHKQFYLGQSLTRKAVKDKYFADKVVGDLITAMPYFDWLRKVVGRAPEKIKKRR